MIEIDIEKGIILEKKEHDIKTYHFGTPEAFALMSKIWLRAGWESKHVYTFSWLGRPIIQLPEDIIRIQEVFYQIKPDVMIETGIAHGGSIIFYAGLCKLIGKGRVIGVDVEIRSHNRKAIEAHELFPYITLIEGSSIEAEIVNQVKSLVKPDETVLIMLDSNHTKEHLLAELNAYAELVSPGSYIIVADGIMKDLVGCARTHPNWAWNNPFEAAQTFIKTHPEFVFEPPQWPFNESNGLKENVVTYWPGAWLRRL
jgi:cephalosporin hydroxylase